MENGASPMDIPESKLSETYPAIDNTVLAMITGGAPLCTVLNALCRVIEEQFSKLVCSVLLLDPAGRTLRHEAGPNLPESYKKAVDGLIVGPDAGSCGIAAYRGEPVIVSDMSRDPLWSEFRRLAAADGLQSCWSIPIKTKRGKVLGTFAIYCRESRRPDPLELRVVEQAAHLAEIAIERKRSEDALRHAENKYRSIVENASEGIFQTTPGGGYLTVNPALARMYGYELPEELMASVNDIGGQVYVDPSRRQEFKRLMEERSVVQGFEYQVYRKDRSKIWLSENVRAVRDSSGEILYYEGMVEDITERKQLEEQLRRAQKMEAIGQLAGGVAHDFNNLLMVIQGHSDVMLARLDAADPLRKSAEGVQKATERAASLTRQLLAFSRMQVLRPKVLDLNAVLAEMGKMLPSVIREDIELRIVPGESLGSVKVDQGQIEQVILNLVVNARDAMPQGGKLTIEAKSVELDDEYAGGHTGVQPGKYAMLAVSDTGVGMDSETQAHIFEPFFTTKEIGKGTGLGLATVYGIVKQSSGWIWVYSEVGKGTTFKIYLPQVGERIQAPESSKARSLAPGGNETILVVEDQESIRELICEFLKSRGYTTLEATDGSEALQLAERYEAPIDLLVTDVVMPKMGGRELADRLSAARPLIKVLHMSGYAEHSAAEPGALEQSAVWLQKPFSLESLLHKVREVLDGRFEAGNRSKVGQLN
jgi:two-component system, cell cycle sensor histidine kinase and response regulator CckA